MRAIFISYRRDDTEGYAGRLFQDLSEAFGAGTVFMDVTAIEPGIDFRKAIERHTASCGVLLALIGPTWLSATGPDGRRRLDNPDDFVRLETASALRRDIPVIPVLVQNALMPHADELPDDLKDLAYRNGVELTHARWDSDVHLLIEALRPHVERTLHGDLPDVRGAAPAALPAAVLVPAAPPATGRGRSSRRPAPAPRPARPPV
jgi:TIR domain